MIITITTQLSATERARLNRYARRQAEERDFPMFIRVGRNLYATPDARELRGPADLEIAEGHAAVRKAMTATGRTFDYEVTRSA